MQQKDEESVAHVVPPQMKPESEGVDVLSSPLNIVSFGCIELWHILRCPP